jgi:hypothetical protein
LTHTVGTGKEKKGKERKRKEKKGKERKRTQQNTSYGDNNMSVNAILS